VEFSDAIEQFQTERREMALVIEDSVVIGLVTVTDLLEAVTGNIQDPLDRGNRETTVVSDCRGISFLRTEH
jgi:IMP dehydrogenase